MENRTGGVVTDRDAQEWADAASRTGAWTRWALANRQFSILSFLGGTTAGRLPDLSTASAFAELTLRDCLIYPTRVALVLVDAGAHAQLAKFNNDAPFALVFTLPTPCRLTGSPSPGAASPPALHDVVLTNAIAFPGSPVDDPALGKVWYATTGITCSPDTVAPLASWCSGFPAPPIPSPTPTPGTLPS